MRTLTVRSGDVDLAMDVDGDGPTALLLHGWPDTARLWDDVAPRLVAAGFRVATPDLRGCGRSSKPVEVERYRMAELVGDVVALIDALDVDNVALVGHDWGAALAWASTAYLPTKVSALAALSVGHPTSFRSGGIDQQMRSWYMLLFIQPDVGERFLRHHDYEALRHWMRHPRADEVIAELERDGQMTTHLNWYRANFRADAFFTDPPTLPAITVPVLGLWSTRDVALTERQMVDSAAYCDAGFTYARVDDAGHWTPLETPQRVADEVIALLRASL